MSILKLRYLILTLVDIGPRQLNRRVRYELRQLLDCRLPLNIAVAWACGRGSTPPLLPVLFDLQLRSTCPLTTSTNTGTVVFSFLNQQRQLSLPFAWNNPAWSRLWQFHLHYFDWARDWMNTAFITGNWPDQSTLLEPLLDQWIDSNPPRIGDGWHSYTISLRTRNWIWLFRACPKLATPSRIDSLWRQLLWLQSHPEYCHGGNHWLENLTALAIGGLQFDGPEATAMHSRAMTLLQRELSSQVLPDGGHEERSASYHLLILDRLVELACTLAAIHGQSPTWLDSCIGAMTEWVSTIRLQGGLSPRFNDSAQDASPPLDVILSFAKSYLCDCVSGSGFRYRLLYAARTGSHRLDRFYPSLLTSSSSVTDLPDTGWTFLRPGYGWELVFKCGQPCPVHLPSHVHSDQLSFELIHRGHWLLSEAGTSVYGNCPQRDYERSSAAHNVLQLGLQTSSGDIEWIEPVEVWGGFRAARKAKPRDRQSGKLSDGSCFASGSHDGFDQFGASHVRHVQLGDPRPFEITLSVVDTVITRRSLHFCQWWHLAPSVPSKFMDSLVFEASTAESIQISWRTTWFSPGFGERIARQSLCISGRLPPGEHYLHLTLPVSVSSLSLLQICPASG